MTKRTFENLIDNVTEAVNKQEMDLGPADVGYIVSLFLEGVIHDSSGPPLHPAVAAFLQTMADAAAAVSNE